MVKDAELVPNNWRPQIYVYMSTLAYDIGNLGFSWNCFPVSFARTLAGAVVHMLLSGRNRYFQHFKASVYLQTMGNLNMESEIELFSHLESSITKSSQKYTERPHRNTDLIMSIIRERTFYITAVIPFLIRQHVSGQGIPC
jgi:hypothetical protein